MKLSRTKTLFIIAISLFSAFVSITQETKLSKLHFPKLKNYRVELKCLTQNLEFPPGKKAKITFGLKNIGATPIMCHEWKMDEKQNLSILYTEWKGEKNLKDAPWQKEIPPAVGNPQFMPLELAPNNSVLIDKELKFVEKIPENISSPIVFYIYAELNLESMSAKSPITKIVVAP